MWSPLAMSLAVTSMILGLAWAASRSCEREAARRNDDNDRCHTYFRCDKRGDVEEVDCPRGLFWNSNEEFCDFPDNATCKVSESDVDLLLPRETRLIYLTFDDGPWIGTTEVLDALKKEKVKATFFLNTDKMFNPDNEDNEDGHWTLREGQDNLLREVDEGHVIADHSYDHMFHNNNSGKNDVYVDVGEDLTYFGAKNFKHVEELMEEAGLSRRTQRRVSDTFFRYVRMPYTDNWRIQDKVRLDCLDCTAPGYSVLNGIKTADALAEKYDVEVFGWDIQWATDWDNWSFEDCRHEYGAIGLLMRLMELPTKQKNKIVILTHEFMYYSRRPCGRWNLRQLKLFLRLAKDLGYVFRTVDTYDSDDVQRDFGSNNADYQLFARSSLRGKTVSANDR